MTKRFALVTIGLFIGLAFALAILVLFVEPPAECGEPAACGDDHLFPAGYFAFVSAFGFPALGWLSAGASSWRQRLRPFGFSSSVVTICILVAIVFRSVARHV
jgi:hypothetical protein